MMINFKKCRAEKWCTMENIDNFKRENFTSIRLQEDYLSQMNENKREKFFGVHVLQNIITVIGLCANILTTITLVVNGREFPCLTRILFVHQAIVDSLVCLLAIILYSQHFMWMTGNTIFDLLLCQVWHVSRDSIRQKLGWYSWTIILTIVWCFITCCFC